LQVIARPFSDRTLCVYRLRSALSSASSKTLSAS
jgi:hypothetical protein